MEQQEPDTRDVALGLAVSGTRVGLAAGRVALLPARMVVRAPLLGAPLRRAARDLAHEGSLARERARIKLEDAAGEVLAAPEVEKILARLGPDPLRPRANAGLAHRRIARSRTAIGALLMDQSVLAGVGNVYRAEILFRHNVSPFRPGRAVDEPLWAQMWSDLVTLMRSGVRLGRIVTTRPEDRFRRRGAVQRADAHYVYRRTGLPCRVCGTEVHTEVMVGRNLYWCPACQAA